MGDKIRDELQKEMLGALNKEVHIWSLQVEAMETCNTALEELVVSLHYQVEEVKIELEIC